MQCLPWRLFFGCGLHKQPRLLGLCLLLHTRRKTRTHAFKQMHEHTHAKAHVPHASHAHKLACAHSHLCNSTCMNIYTHAREQRERKRQRETSTRWWVLTLVPLNFAADTKAYTIEPMRSCTHTRCTRTFTSTHTNTQGVTLVFLVSLAAVSSGSKMIRFQGLES